jgi:hypothetical protein
MPHLIHPIDTNVGRFSRKCEGRMNKVKSGFYMHYRTIPRKPNQISLPHNKLKNPECSNTSFLRLRESYESK